MESPLKVSRVTYDPQRPSSYSRWRHLSGTTPPRDCSTPENSCPVPKLSSVVLVTYPEPRTPALEYPSPLYELNQTWFSRANRPVASQDDEALASSI